MRPHITSTFLGIALGIAGLLYLSADTASAQDFAQSSGASCDQGV